MSASQDFTVADNSGRPATPVPARSRSQLLFGAVALALGLAVLGCFDLFPGGAFCNQERLAWGGANTALCLVLAGVALLLSGARSRGCRRAAAGAGMLVLLAGAATLLQPAFGLYADSHGWQHLFNADPRGAGSALWPGSMRAGAAFAFVCAGAGLGLAPWLTGKRRIVPCALGTVAAAVALPSLFSNLLGSVLFDGGAGRVLLPLPAALGVAAVGLGLVASAAGGGAAALAERADRRIFLTSLALFAAVSVVASLVGIGIVGRYAMQNFQQAWLDSFRSNAGLFRASLERTASRGEDVMRFARLPDARARGAAAPLQVELERVARLAGFGPSGTLAVVDADGRTLGRAGTARWRGQFSLALALPGAPRLYWQDGWRLLSSVPLAGGAHAVLDLGLDDFNRRFAQMNALGQSGETRVCGLGDGELLCFPSRLHGAPTRVPLTGTPRELPARRAFAGEAGVADALDYRGQEVIAAYGMIEGTGLALVQKVDAEEFYRPLRRQLWFALLGMTLLVLAGALILYWRTHPLVFGLVRARARLHAILHNVPAGVFTFDADGTVLSANRAACAMFGYEPAALIGMRIGQLMPEWHELLIEQKEPRQLAGFARDGGRLALEVVANQFLLGHDFKRIAIVHDVGARVRIEQALRQRSASLAHAQQLAHIGSWERDIASGAYFWSDETFRIFGLAPGGTAPGHDAVTLLVHPDDRALKLRSEEESMAGVRDYDVSFRILLPGGVIKVVHSRAEVDFDGAGRALRFRGTLQDITEKAWADELLRKREEEYRALVEHSPDVVVRFDHELRCVYVNPAIASSPGLRAVIAYGRRLDALDAAAAPWAAAVQRALCTGCKGAFEVAVADPDETRHYQVRVVPEFRQGGRVAAALATARDISAIRRGEALLRELSAHREHVREEERKKIAREVHDELGQALTALRMDVALLRLTGGPHSPELLERIGSMKEAVDRTIGIVRNVTSALRPAALDLGLTAALEWQVDEFARRAGIECMLHTGDTEVVLDDSHATALFRIVQESLTNVLKHAGATEVEVTLEALDDSVHLEVCDNGAGFTPGEAPRPGKFGLVGMRERVLMLGGRVDIHSNPGVGTCIRVHLPLTTTQTGATAPQD